MSNNHLRIQNNDINTPITDSAEPKSIDLNLIFRSIVKNWGWFLISLIITLGAAWMYTHYTSPVYQSNAQVLVKDEKSGSSGAAQAIGGAFSSDIGSLLGGTSSKDNEIEVLKTQYLMRKVVEELRLNVTYYTENGWVKHELFKSPINTVIIKANDTIKNCKIRISDYNNDHFTLNDNNIEKQFRWNQPVTIKEVGIISIQKIGALNGQPFIVEFNGVDSYTDKLLKNLSVTNSNKQSSVLDLSFNYPNAAKGELILNTLINNYLRLNLQDKNDVADSTIYFIQQRLQYLGSDLGDLETNIQNYRQENNVADLTEQGKVLIQNSAQYTNELAKAETQVAIYSSLRDQLVNGKGKTLPTTLTPNDLVFSNLVNRYNGLVTERERQLLSSTEDNPVIQNLQGQINSARREILSNIESTRRSYQLTANNLRSQLSQTETAVRSVPKTERNYVRLARQQKIKEELYLFLMQKAEEVAISKSSNIPIAKIIDPAKANIKPISPNKSLIYLGGILLGLLLPAAALLINSLTNIRLGTKDDVTGRTVQPIIGEISKLDSEDNLVVANSSRSPIAEQFRALRTNLSFLLTGQGCKTILITSSMAGEGKSFVAVNLATVFALTGKKVIIMEMDLRRPGIVNKLNIKKTPGFTNYIIDDALNSGTIVHSTGFNENLDIITSGPLPPNPAETIMSTRTEELFNYLKEYYDYIIIDSPPVGVVADSVLLSQYSDVTLFVVRQGVTYKDQLSNIDRLLSKFGKTGLVINDISSQYANYGYSYGYGSYEMTPEKKKGLMRLFSRK